MSTVIVLVTGLVLVRLASIRLRARRCARSIVELDHVGPSSEPSRVQGG